MLCTQAVDYVCRESQLSDMPGYEILLVGKEGLVAGLQGERVGTFPPELSVRSQRCEQQQVGFCADGTVGRGPRLVLSGGRRLYQVPGSGSGGQRDLGGGAGHSPLPEGLACLQAAPVYSALHSASPGSSAPAAPSASSPSSSSNAGGGGGSGGGGGGRSSSSSSSGSSGGSGGGSEAMRRACLPTPPVRISA